MQAMLRRTRHPCPDIDIVGAITLPILIRMYGLELAHRSSKSIPSFLPLHHTGLAVHHEIQES